MQDITTTDTRLDTDRTTRRTLLVILGVWLALALTFASSGLLLRAPKAVPALLWGLVITCIVAYRASPSMRSALGAIDLRVFVALHALRAPIGALFLFEHARGQLPGLFAHNAGYGDVAVGIAALVVASTKPRRAVLVVFSVFGLADILLAFGSAMFSLFVLRDPLMASALGRFPYGALPTFIVPLVIVTHLYALARLRRGQSWSSAMPSR